MSPGTAQMFIGTVGGMLRCPRFLIPGVLQVGILQWSWAQTEDLACLVLPASRVQDSQEQPELAPDTPLSAQWPDWRTGIQH